MRIGVRILEFFMHAWVIFLNKYLCMLIMIPGECTDPLTSGDVCCQLLKTSIASAILLYLVELTVKVL